MTPTNLTEREILVVIVSYNLYGYLANLANSVLKYMPQAHILIMDNGSTYLEMRALLNEYNAHEKIHVHFRSANQGSAKVGALYQAYNEAITYAIAEKYKHILFLQDDMQLVSEVSDVQLKHIFSILAQPKISMVCPVFHKKILRHAVLKNLESSPDLNTYKCKNYGLMDVGFMSVLFIQKHKFTFGKDENQHSKHWLDKGYHVHYLARPFLAFLPWPSVRRRGKLAGKPFGILSDLILDPVVVEKDGLHYAEDYCRSKQFKYLAPYWYTDCSWQYWKLLIKSKLKLKYLGDGKHSYPDFAQWGQLLAPRYFRRIFLRK